MSFPSPLRYPGSKRRLMTYVANALQANKFRPQLYVEPFIGGGSVMLHLLQHDLVEEVILIDVDPWITSFWKTAFRDSDWLIDQIAQAPVTLEAWQALKNSTPSTRREKAWACFFLNRTNFSGILRSEVGPIGGLDQASQYKIDCRFTRQTLIDRIRKVASLRSRVAAIWNVSWEQGIRRIKEHQASGKLPTDGLFYYLDPPFFEKADELYRYYFRQRQHRALRDALLKLPNKWLLSYDSAKEVEDLYGSAIADNTNGTKRSEAELLYSLSILRERKIGKEVILSNLDVLPDFNGHQ